ncbi:MAG: GNAT family N-acetyltransferase [Clostridia bacterium]|nr:GNAT family N-acetyltransferase [Clostridia bacterium]
MGNEFSNLLLKVESRDEINQFSKFKVDLIKYHQQYANKLGLFDIVVDDYDDNKAIRNIGEKGFYQFLINYDNRYVGMVEYQIQKSEIDNESILYLKDIYIEESCRGLGIGSKIISELKKLDYRIELECWYGMPANELYRSIGAKELKTRYMIQ